MKNVIHRYWCTCKCKNPARQQRVKSSRDESYTEICICEADTELINKPENGVRRAAGLQRDGVAHLVADVDIHFISHTQGQIYSPLPVGLRAHDHAVLVLGQQAELSTPLGDLTAGSEKQPEVRMKETEMGWNFPPQNSPSDWHFLCSFQRVHEHTAAVTGAIPWYYLS